MHVGDGAARGQIAGVNGGDDRLGEPPSPVMLQAGPDYVLADSERCF